MIHKRVANSRAGLELLWNEFNALKEIDSRIPGSFRTPHPVTFYAYSSRRGYSEMEHLEGTQLGTRNELSPEFEKNIPKIAKYLVALRKAKFGELPNDEFKLSNLSFLNYLSQNPSARHLIWKFAKRPAYALGIMADHFGISRLAESCEYTRSAPAHGEVSPWHILSADDLSLVDFRHATNRYPEHYDVAHLAARLAVAYGMPDLGRTLLVEYSHHLEAIEPDAVKYFEKNIMGLVAIRALGELRDAAINNQDLEAKVSLAKKLVGI